MLTELKKSWLAFKKGAPGERFEGFYRARRQTHPRSRIVFAIVGGLLLAGGVILLFIPGPGILLIAFGGALIARQSLWMAKLLDEVELFLRKATRGARAFWRKASMPVRALLLAVAGAGSAAGGYATYLWLFRG
jgi:hypothetical protein